MLHLPSAISFSHHLCLQLSLIPLHLPILHRLLTQISPINISEAIGNEKTRKKKRPTKLKIK